MDKILLIAPAEGIFGSYRAQAASGLRIDAFRGDVPGLLALGCVLLTPAAELVVATEELAQALPLEESDDTTGGFAG